MITPSTNDSWETRIKNASVFLNKSVEEVEQILKVLGVEREPSGLEMLSDEEVTPFGDLRRIFCEENNVPVAKLRMAMKILRGPKNSQTTESLDPELFELKQKFGVKLGLRDIGTVDLLPYYNPTRPDHPITKVLKERWDNTPIILFKPDSREIDIEATCNYVSDLEMGYDPSDVEIDGVLVTPLLIGQLPDEKIDEDPLFPGQALKRNRSTVNYMNWTNVPLETRQFIRILVERKDIDINNRLALKSLFVSNAMDELKSIYPEAYKEFRQKRTDNDLPKLKVTLGDSSGKPQDPFGQRKY